VKFSICRDKRLEYEVRPAKPEDHPDLLYELTPQEYELVQYAEGVYNRLQRFLEAKVHKRQSAKS